MFPFFFPSQISLKIEISRYLSPDGGRGGGWRIFLGGITWFSGETNRVWRGSAENWLPIRCQWEKITKILQSLVGPTTRDLWPPSPSQAKSNNRFLTFSPYLSYLKISRNPDFINFFSGHRKLKEKKINEEDRQNSCHTTKDLMSAFHIFDAQNKGYIESRELREALGLTGAGIPDDELKKMLQETGLLTDRKITFAGKFLCRRFM